MARTSDAPLIKRWTAPLPHLESLRVEVPSSPMDRMVSLLPKFILVSGKPRPCRVGSRSMVVGQGDVLFVPAGEVHGGTTFAERGMVLDILIGDFGNSIGGTEIQVGSPPVKRALIQLQQAVRSGEDTLLAESALLELEQALDPRQGQGCQPGPNRLRRAKQLLADGPHDVTLKEVALELGMTSSHFCRAFTEAFGISPHAWLIAVRTERSRQILNRANKIAEVALETGFFDQAHFTHRFARTYGITPKQYRDQTLSEQSAIFYKKPDPTLPDNGFHEPRSPEKVGLRLR